MGNRPSSGGAPGVGPLTRNARPGTLTFPRAKHWSRASTHAVSNTARFATVPENTGARRVAMRLQVNAPPLPGSAQRTGRSCGTTTHPR
ncbi:MAG: hypothetical protein HZC42_07690 [Candidatus Eisenbacteria bacterium]|nr:hypothetical protein [Candidatus Eisenbacteria bacterium]